MKVSPGAGSPAVDAMLAAIRKKNKAVAAQLRPGASEAALESLRALDVPPALLSLYAAHDGSEAEIFGAFQLLSIADIESERKTMNDLLARTPEWRASGRWNERWVPFLADGDGQYHVLDPVGSLEGGAPGNILIYDHEAGPARELASFDVLVDLITTLAKKGLLLQEAQENEAEQYEKAYAAAQNVGLARMPPKELKKALATLGDAMLGPEEKLEIALPLARKYGAERDLWSQVLHAAKGLQRWALMAEAAARTERLTPARDRPFVAREVVLALHRLGRDDDALAALSAALKTKTNYPRSQIPDDADPAFCHRCFVLATELRPNDHELWLERGERATEREERLVAFQKAIDLADARPNAPLAAAVKKAAERLVELTRIEGLQGKARLDALVALAEAHHDYFWGTLGKHHGDTWVRVARCATEIGEWTTAEMAGAHVIGLLYKIPLAGHLLAGYRVLALHELHRDEEALALLKEVIADIYDKESSEALETINSIPWSEARGPEERAFEARCLELATDVQPENVFLWHLRAFRAAKMEDRRSAFEKVVELASAPERANHVPSPTLAPEFRLREEKKHAEIRRMKVEAEEQLRRG